MSQHNPNINWNTGEILQWSESCFHTCLSSVQKSPISHSQPSKSKPTTLSINSTTVESPEVDHQGEIPLQYWAFQDVFSKRLATQLPPHRPWDCAIDLLPGATLPKGRVYPLSIWSRRPWRSTFRSHSNNTSFDHLHPLPLRVSSSWQKRMEDCGRVSTTVISTLKLMVRSSGRFRKSGGT